MADEARPKKKLPFKQTALKRTPSLPVEKGGDDEDENDGLDLFRRRGEMASKLAEDHERRLKKKQRKLEEKQLRQAEEEELNRQREESDRKAMDLILAQQKSSNDQSEAKHLADQSAEPPGQGGSSRESNHVNTPPPSKRLRMTRTPTSSQRSGRHASPIHSDGNQSRGLDVLASSEKTPPPSSSSSSSRHLRSNPAPYAASSSFATSVLISLDSDSEPAPETPTPHKDRVPRPGKDYLGEAGDDDISIVEPGEDQDGDEDPGAKWEKLAEERRAQLQSQTVRAQVEIMITSAIPETKPARFKFLFDKSLKVVRDTWCAMQRQKGIYFPVAVDDILLTWKRRKVYMTDTLDVLGVKPRSNGNGLILSDHSSDGLTKDRTMIHMEIWTPDLYQEMQTIEANKQKDRDRELSEDEQVDDSRKEPEEEVQKLRVILRAQNAKDVKLSVRPETTVETLLTAYRAKSEVGSGRSLSLWFDGEQMNEHVTMGEAEIDDMDTLEVHIA